MMKLLSYNEILTKICDDFDTLITPKRIARRNTNIVYLMFKAISKGFELINNICVVLSYKFDPLNCSSEDLESVSAIVGTKRLQGSETGLHIIVTNTDDSVQTLLNGTYYYDLDENTKFYFDVLEDTEIGGNNYTTFIAMSENIGSYPVTEQTAIKVTSVKTINDKLKFSCQDNNNLLGREAETDAEFRKRINEGTNNQDSIVELENELKNLPYLFDCKCKFNQTVDSILEDEITIPPFSLAIFYSGMPRNEIANIVASRIICPTVKTSDSTELKYVNNIFARGEYAVNIIPFKEIFFTARVTLHIDEHYVEANKVKSEILSALTTKLTSSVHKDYVKEEDIYEVIKALNLTGVDILGADLIYNGEEKEYIEVPVSRIPSLNGVTFILR